MWGKVQLGKARLINKYFTVWHGAVRYGLLRHGKVRLGKVRIKSNSFKEVCYDSRDIKR